MPELPAGGTINALTAREYNRISVLRRKRHGCNSEAERVWLAAETSRASKAGATKPNPGVVAS